MDARRDYEWTVGGKPRSLINATQAEALSAGVPAGVIAAGAVADRLAAIKAGCKRRIYAEASPETQMNMNAVATLIGARSASARSEEETATLAAHASAVAWVKAMRDTCPALATDADSDWQADASWPAPPADAAAFAASV